MSPWARAPHSECKASNCPRTATANRLGMLPVPDMCDQVKSPLGLKRHPRLKLRSWSCLVSSQGVASPPLPNGCGRQLQGPHTVQGPARRTCSQASEERANEARAMAIPHGPRRHQGPLGTSAWAGRRTSRRRVSKPVHVRTKPRTKKVGTHGPMTPKVNQWRQSRYGLRACRVGEAFTPKTQG